MYSITGQRDTVMNHALMQQQIHAIADQLDGKQASGKIKVEES